MTTWLTQIAPNFRNPAAHQDLRDAVRMHQRVMSLVPDGLGDQPRQQAGVLYRVEERPGGARVLVQTQLKPNLERLPTGYGTAQARDLELLLRWLVPGRLVRYRLAANTCRRLSRSTKVVPLRGADADEWWIARALGCGLELQSVTSRSPGDAIGGGAPEKRIRHTLTQFDGVAAVADARALSAAITAGVGRGKSHGCGLLSIAPVSTGE